MMTDQEQQEDRPLQKCYKCGQSDYECFDERHVTWWQPDGFPAGTQVIALFRCQQCGTTWSVDDPSDAEMAEGGNYTDSESPYS